MKFSISSLLRRTLIVAGALLALAVAAPAAAVQTVTLSGQTAVGSCTYTGSITVLPDGTLSITCVPTSSTNAFFTLSYPSQLAINTTDTSSVKVTRSGGTGAASVGVTITGTGCTNLSNGNLTFADPTSPAQALTITTLATPGPCTITLLPAVSTDTASGAATITVYDPGSTSTTVPAGCPTPAIGTTVAGQDLGLIGAQPSRVLMSSGKIGYWTVIAAPNPPVSVAFIQGQMSVTPAGLVTEFSVSKCPGAIFDSSDTTGHYVSQCYVKTTSVNNPSITMYTSPRFTWTDQASLGSRGCWAPAASGPWYVNVRWTYPAGSGYGNSLQWGPGPW